MQMADSFTLHAPPEKVWDFFLDVERMAQYMPGVESVEAQGGGAYRGTLEVKVGPIAARFDGWAEIKELDPPRRMVASISADDSTSASKVMGTFEARLSKTDLGTQVDYEIDVNLRGKLAQFGSAIVLATAKKMTADFTKNIRAQLES